MSRVIGLSKRHREILTLLAAGHPNKEICQQLGISNSTLCTHMEIVFSRLGAKNRTHAAVLFVTQRGSV